MSEFFRQDTLHFGSLGLGLVAGALLVAFAQMIWR